jgi:hypothetical protein
MGEPGIRIFGLWWSDLIEINLNFIKNNIFLIFLMKTNKF